MKLHATMMRADRVSGGLGPYHWNISWCRCLNKSVWHGPRPSMHVLSVWHRTMPGWVEGRMRISELVK